VNGFHFGNNQESELEFCRTCVCVCVCVFRILVDFHFLLLQVAGHQTAFINELKLSDFKQVLNKNSIPSEFSGGVLWCCNGTIAVRRVSLRMLHFL
jgi:hypothetical protein